MNSYTDLKSKAGHFCPHYYSRDCLDTLQRLRKKNSLATRAKLSPHQYLQEDNTSVVKVHSKQINDAVFIDLDKDKLVYPAQYCNGGR